VCQVCFSCGMCNHGAGRDEPRPDDVCPCGHGKRYKDCCGKDLSLKKLSSEAVKESSVD
jgi:uncharacterized protein YchJ